MYRFPIFLSSHNVIKTIYHSKFKMLAHLFVSIISEIPSYNVEQSYNKRVPNLSGYEKYAHGAVELKSMQFLHLLK